MENQKYVLVTVRLTDAASKLVGKTTKTLEMLRDENDQVDVEEIYKEIPHEFIVSYNFRPSFRNAKCGDCFLLQDGNGIEHVVKVMHPNHEYDIYNKSVGVTTLDMEHTWYIKTDWIEQTRNKKKAVVIRQIPAEEAEEITAKNSVQQHYIDVFKALEPICTESEKDADDQALTIFTAGKHPEWFTVETANSIKAILAEAKSKYYNDEF